MTRIEQIKDDYLRELNELVIHRLPNRDAVCIDRHNFEYLLARIEKLEKSLKEYSDPKNYQYGMLYEETDFDDSGYGKLAREALAEETVEK